VNDKGTGGGSAFNSVDAGYSFSVEGVGAKTVNGLGGKSHKSSGAEEPGGVVDFAGIASLRPGLRHG